MKSTTNKILFILFAVFAVLVGLYPSAYLFIHRRFGLLSLKPDALLKNVFWNIEFYTHISTGGLALLIGWTQFSTKLRTRHLKIHKRTGKVYVIAALISASAAIYIGLYATGGIISSAGFICLAIIWFYTTLRAYIEIRRLHIDEHKKMMTYSYAACFAAVTFRICLPLMAMLFNNFNKGYSIAAWLGWIPNLIVAYFLNKRFEKQNKPGETKIFTIEDKRTTIQQANRNFN